MSTTIDSRVVEMQFDNRNFERNVQTSMSTLEKLKQSLNLTGAAKGLTEIDSASKKLNFSGLGTAVDTVQAKFSALQIMGVTALANITNSAVNAGKRIANALTIAPIRTGFQEYETQINAVQTILANTESKGTTLQDVNRALDELNTYADKTIYNFTQMTKNIGTFTAAGVDLKTSVGAIQGIANLAAVSGSTSQQASTAMYQLSQALAAGRVNLMDWNSVVNAGMGGQVFQNALKETSKAMAENAKKLRQMSEEELKAYAKQHGYTDEQMENIKNYSADVDAIIKKEKSFRNSLSKGEWLTTDVLTKTLEQFTMAADKGSEKWEMYKKSLMDDGHTEKQAEAILKMANTATDAATKVKTFTQLWETLKESAQSGWTQTWEIIVGDFGEAKEFLTQISDTIGGMLQSSADARNQLLSAGLSSGWKQLLNGGTVTLEEGKDPVKWGIADESGYMDAIKTVAKEHKIAIDEMIEKEKELDPSLTDSDAFQKAIKNGLADGVLTSDMLSESVTKLTDKMSKMSLSELEAAGYTADHVIELKHLNTALKEGKISMEEFTNKIMRPSGRENLIESLWNVCKGIMSVIKPIKSAFDEIFPAMEGEQLYKFTEKLKDFTSKLTLSAESAEKLKTTFKGVFSFVRTVIDGVKTFGVAAIDLLKNFKGVGGFILDAGASFGTWLSKISDSATRADIFAKAVEKIKTFVGNAISKIKDFGKAIDDAFHTPTMEGLLGFFQGIWEVVKVVGSGVAKIFEPLGKFFSMSFDGANIFDLFNSGILVSGIAGLSRIAFTFESFYGKLAGGYGVLDYLKDAFDEAGDALYAWQTTLKAETLIKIGAAIGIIAASILVLSSIDPKGLDQSVGAITILLAELVGAFAVFSLVDGKRNPISALMRSFEHSTNANALVKMAAAIAILSGSLWVLSKIDAEAMERSLGAMTASLAELLLAVTGLSFLNSNGAFVKAGTSMILIATAMLLMASAVKAFGSMDLEQLAKGLVAMGIALGAVVAALNLLPRDVHMKASKLFKFADGKKTTNFVSAGIAMIAMAGAMKLMCSAVKDFAEMKWDDLIRGLVGFSVAIMATAGAMRLMPKNAFGVGAGLLVAAAAMKVMVSVLNDFVKMGQSGIDTSLVALCTLLIELTIALNCMKGAVSGSAALIIAAGALAILAPVLKSLGDMSWESIIKGMIALAGAFTIIGVAGLLLGPMIPILMQLAGACALFGLATLGIGFGVLALSTGLAALVAAVSGGATAIVAALGVIIIGIMDLLPEIVLKLGDVILAICKVLVECAPQIADTILVVISEVLASLATYTPQIIDSLFTFVIGLLDGLAARLPELIQSAVNLIGAFFQGIADALSGIDTTNLLKGIAGAGLLAGLMWALSSVVGLIPGAMAGVLGMGIVIAELAAVLAVVGGLAQIPGLSWLIEEGGNFLQTIGTAIGKFVGGIVGGIAEGATSTLPAIGTNLSSFMTNLKPFLDGAKGIDESVVTGVKSIANAVLALTGANLLDSLTSWLTGGSSLSEFGKELAKFGPYMADYANSVSGIDTAAIKASVSAAKALVKVADEIPNTGGVASWFSGDNDLGSFTKKLVPFGKGMKSYADSVSGIDTAAITASVTSARKIISLMNDLSNTKTSGVTSFTTALSTLGKTSVNEFINAFKGASSKLATIGSDMFNAIIKGMKYSQNSLIVTITPAINNMLNAMKRKQTDFSTVGKMLMTHFVTGVKSQSSKMSSAIIAPLKSSVANVRSYYSSFYNAGAYISNGLAAGMRSRLYAVKSAANEMAAAANKAARAALLVRSPSRVFYAIGEFVVQGFTNALGDGASSVYNTAKDMADYAKTGFNNAINKINGVFSDGIDSQPTIRPVLDLSDVKSGASAINGMFNSTQSVGVMSNIRSISSMMGQRNQNGANADIVSELSKLRSELGNVGGNSYNINGITYNDDSPIANAMKEIVRATIREGRV